MARVAVSSDEKSAAGFPLQRGMGLSHWQQTTRANPLLNHRSTADLPTGADVVVIGSGISGAVAALSLLQDANPPRSIVMLEARELCSGATGKNAGHCKPDVWRGFCRYAERVGVTQAMKTWEALVDYITKEKVDCDVWVGKTLDVLMDDESVRAAAVNFEAFKAAGGNVSPIDISRIHGAKAVYAWNASTLHPFKLGLGLNLQTWTPATSVEGSANQWVVRTERGSISTPTVIHATNGFAGTLLPETRSVIIPTPHMCDRVVPPASFSGSFALQNSYAVISTKGMYSINPRSTSDGVILFGGTSPNIHKLEEYVARDHKRQVDDSLINFKPVTDAVRELGTNGFRW
ncbi:hypothetical protein CI109_101363 [Kwoniella shandongensis]|uniref:FAD dependent oxidoreductase domain-containing protein n=1 Tax=Kwoniella shandongensis TaxID=1734106 RepID=A0AAJ8MVS8_9TREE